MEECNVLITSAGRRTCLVEGFKKALLSGGYSGKVVCLEMDKLSAALYLSDKYYIVPPATNGNYIDIVLDICKKERIKLLVPTTDIELDVFASKTEIFLNNKTRVLVSSPETIRICNDKYQSFIFFKKLNLNTPITAICQDKDAVNAVPYPRILKKRVGGHGSINQFIARDKEEYSFYLRYFDDPLIQQYVTGSEYTIDVLNDFSGRTVSVVPRIRIETRAGVTDKGKTVKDPRLIEYGRLVAERLNIIGPANVQCIEHEGEFYFTEVNPRFSGGILLTLQAGADFLSLLIKMLQGHNVEPQIGSFTEGLIVLRHQPGIFIDQDFRVVSK